MVPIYMTTLQVFFLELKTGLLSVVRGEGRCNLIAVYLNCAGGSGNTAKSHKIVLTLPEKCPSYCETLKNFKT